MKMLPYDRWYKHQDGDSLCTCSDSTKETFGEFNKGIQKEFSRNTSLKNSVTDILVTLAAVVELLMP